MTVRTQIVGAVRSLGQVLVALAGLGGLGAAACIARIWTVAERCPPDSVCDGRATLTALTLFFAVPGLAFVGWLGWFLIFIARRAAARREEAGPDSR